MNGGYSFIKALIGLGILEGRDLHRNRKLSKVTAERNAKVATWDPRITEEYNKIMRTGRNARNEYVVQIYNGPNRNLTPTAARRLWLIHHLNALDIPVNLSQVDSLTGYAAEVTRNKR